MNSESAHKRTARRVPTQPWPPRQRGSVADPPRRRSLMPGETDALGEVRQRERRYRIALALADMAAAGVSLPFSLGVVGNHHVHASYLLVLPLVVIAAKLLRLYDRDELVIRKSTMDEVPRLLNLATTFALLTWLARHFIVDGAPGTTELLALWISLMITTCGFRILARTFAGAISPTERCLVIGDENVFHRLHAKLDGHDHVALIGAAPLNEALSDHSTIQALTDQLGAHRIIIAPNQTSTGEAMVDLVRAAKATGLRVSLLPDILGAVGGSVEIDTIEGITLLGVPRFGLTRSSSAIKRAFDLVGAGAMVVVAAPIMSAVALLIRLDSPGPVFFRQTRVGRDGRHFPMLKFRSMVDGADALKSNLADLNEADGLFKIAVDPRVTRFGRLLRRSHLDELPQLLNILRGEMSLVGPRPLVVDEDERITGFDRRRLLLTPGMTGHWQTLGSTRVPLAEMVKIDYLYVANWSLWMDVKILARTIPMVIKRRGV